MKAMDTKTSLEHMLEDVLKRPSVNLSEIKHTYAIISTPRSGSKMFVDKLKSTGLMGDPMEWFNLRYIKAYQAVTGVKNLKFGDYVKDIVRHTATENGVFGLNYHVDQYLSLQKRKINMFKYVKFNKTYAIERRNKLAQAFSLSKARVTDIWSSNIPLKEGDQEKIDAITKAQVINEVHTLAVWQGVYDKQLAKLVDEKFVYEDVVKDTEGDCFKRVMADLGQQPPEGHSFETGLKRQSNDKDKARIAELRQFILGEQV